MIQEYGQDRRTIAAKAVIGANERLTGNYGGFAVEQNHRLF
jgi:hypothetical protein